MKVYVVHYTHKHDGSISVFSTPDKAEASADSLITDRAAESWDQEDRDRLARWSSFVDRLEYFHAVEKDVSYGETIELMECEVQ